MDRIEADLRRIATEVWETLLALSLQPDEGEDAFEEVCASVQIAGAWMGSISLGCKADLARRLAGKMFDTDPSAVSGDDVRDAMSELANMVGGNMKATLPGPSMLSLPTVVEGQVVRLSFPGTTCVSRVRFSCEGAPLTLWVHQLTEAEAA